ncbi:hypothetical protein CERZMDRAFT_83600 [Cercospora zeae-maydis SCOH1-5]|uniref:Uncharacterized protein n=1 Tax=Cercospora zeae-maydis SCOH1-5 TaxID=717836 RepID=A0A6A6FJ17_9PEZI|nr:hypothetical protein CERZMDRAFT_83600 [Cercospora zeae-maydis SCOH1-5]
MDFKRRLADALSSNRPSKRQSTSPPTSPSNSAASSVTLDGHHENTTVAPRKNVNNLASQYRYFSEQTPPPPSPPTRRRPHFHPPSSHSFLERAIKYLNPRDTPMDYDNDEDPSLLARSSTDSAQDHLANVQAALQYVDMASNNNTAAATPVDSAARSEPSSRDHQSPPGDIPPNLQLTLTKPHPIPLSSLRYPAVCKAWPPELADPILQHYIKANTFSVKIWSNYDAYDKKFFYDEPRMSDCGKLALSPNERMRLETLDSGNVGIEFPKVRFEVGTPFRTLGYLDSKWCVGGDGEFEKINVEGMMLEREEGLNSPHISMRQLISEAMNLIVKQPTGLWEGNEGFKLGDLDVLADMFLRLPWKRV